MARALTGAACAAAWLIFTSASPDTPGTAAANPSPSLQDRCYEHDAAGNLTLVKVADVLTDPANCGACGRVCGPTRPICQSGVCTACDPRDVDCDGRWPADNCPLKKNPGQEDGDGDGWGDVCDNCPAVSNKDQLNTDHADDGGDACDPDDDNDFCLDGDDLAPTQDSSVVGHRVAANCPDSMTRVFGWDGLDSDNDGVRNCADRDDDGDGIEDDADSCPVNPEQNALVCESPGTSCPVTIPWNVCLLGGCNLFLIRIVSVVNPAVVIRRFTIQESGSLILMPASQEAMEMVERALAGESPRKARGSKPVRKVRIEIWTATEAGKPGTLVSTVATYEPKAVSRRGSRGDSALLVTVEKDGASVSTQRISVTPPRGRGASDRP